ncbi:hypothetical protein KPB2_5338 [Klebsiella pneumoniae Kb677]|nr:hypothetical protein KPB2_5338 [Klebsiella pneumoniae Kb677]
MVRRGPFGVDTQPVIGREPNGPLRQCVHVPWATVHADTGLATTLSPAPISGNVVLFGRVAFSSPVRHRGDS